MILQIKNDLILADLTALESVNSPVNGECYFITSEGGCYSYYSQKGKVIGFTKDLDAVIYSKTTALDVGFTDVTVYFPEVLGTPIEEIKQLYRVYEADGKSYFEEIRAGLVAQYKAGLKTSAEIFEIESKLENTTSKIIKGDWMTAQYHLSLITAAGALEQSLLDEVGAYITSYITNNY